MTIKICVASAPAECPALQKPQTLSGHNEYSIFPMPLKRAELGGLYLKGAKTLVFVGALEESVTATLTAQAKTADVAVEVCGTMAEFIAYLGLTPGATAGLYARPTGEICTRWMPEARSLRLAGIPENTATA